MLSEEKLREIKEYEDAGIDVVVVRGDGTIVYSSNNIKTNDYCDNCSAFKLLPDPDPYDWFRDGDMKAVCLEVNGVIAGALERPSEWTNIPKPLYCPKLNRELSKEEKQRAEKQLDWAKELMK